MLFFKTILKGVNDLFGPSIQPNSHSSNMTESSDPGEAWSESCSNDEEKAVQKLIDIVSSANYEMEVSGFYKLYYQFYFPEYKLKISENYTRNFGDIQINDKTIPLEISSLVKIWEIFEGRRNKEEAAKRDKEREEALETVLLLTPQIEAKEKSERQIFTKIAAILREDNFQKENYCKKYNKYKREIGYYYCYRFPRVKLSIGEKIGYNPFSLGDDSLKEIFTNEELERLNEIWNERLAAEARKEKLAIEENILKVTPR